MFVNPIKGKKNWVNVPHHGSVSRTYEQLDNGKSFVTLIHADGLSQSYCCSCIIPPNVIHNKSAVLLPSANSLQ